MIKNRFYLVAAEAGYRHGDMGRLAKELGVSRATVSFMLNKEGYEPTLKVCLRAAKLFGKRVEDIWWEESEKDANP